jgi:hypothetical protein
MKFASKTLWLTAAAIALSAAPSYALTVWQAPTNSGADARNFADPNSGSQSSAQSSNSNSQKGWNFQFGASSQDNSQNRNFSGAPGDPMFRPYYPPPRNPDSPYPFR